MKRSIVEVVQNMERAMSWRSPGCVFRGEPARFDKISSGLYRTYGLEKGEGDFNIETVENEMVEKARSFTDRKDPFDILCEIQHRGGKTNRIDFTRDLGVALFFACGTAAGMERESGRVIMLDDSEAVRKAGVTIRDITHPIHMAAAQKSVFVSTDSGYLDDRHLPHLQIWTIDADEKQEILQYLRRSRGIDSRSIFMDISGFIRNAHEFENANAWFFRGRKMFLEGDLDGAIEATSNYLRLADDGFEAHPGLHLRGQAYYRKGDHDRAFQDLRRTLRVKRVMNPGAAKILGRFVPSERPAYPLPDDIRKELEKWCKEQERIEEEARRRTKNIRGRTQDNRILQCVISAINIIDTKNSSNLVFCVLTDTGYSYSQVFGQSSDGVMTWPNAFLDFEAACWWSFHGTGHQHVVLNKKTVPEDFEIVIPPKERHHAAPCTVHVKFFAYDPSRQKIVKRDSGEYELVSLA